MEHYSKYFHLNSNQLKLIALVTMTCDHVGLMLLPQFQIFRIIGRIAFPIFAFMIAEGCRYTSHRTRYLLTVFGVGLICQIFYLFAMHSIYQRIMITFTISIGLCYCLQWAKRNGGWSWAVFICFLSATFLLCEVVPLLPFSRDFAIDYRFSGVLLPVIICCSTGRWNKLAATAIGLLLVSLQLGGIQWYCFISLFLLALYDGSRGTRKLKYLFYIYYPLHLVIIGIIGFFVN